MTARYSGSGPRRFAVSRVLVSVASALSGYEWLFLIVVAPLLLFPSPARTLALLAIPLLWLCRKAALGRFFQRTPLDTPLTLMLLMVLVSLYATFNIAYSLPKITGMLLGLAVYYAVAEAAVDRRSWLLALGAFMLAGVGVAALGLLGTQWIHKFALFDSILARLPPRITGLPGAAEGFQPNEVAGALLWVVPLACALAAAAVLGARFMARSLGRVRGAILVVVIVTTAAFLVGVLILTQSRGGWIAAALTLPAVLLLLVRGKLRWAITVLFVGVVTAAVWTAVAHPHALDPLIIGSQGDAGGGMSLETLSGRVEVWSRAIYGIQDFAFTGMGMNAFRKVVPVLYPLFSIGPEVDIAHAHNELLQAALDLGIPGLIAYIAIHMSAFPMLFSTWRRRRSLPYPEPILRALILGLGAGVAAHMLFGVTDAVALGAKPGLLLWMLLGLIASLYRLVPQTPAEAET